MARRDSLTGTQPAPPSITPVFPGSRPHGPGRVPCGRRPPRVACSATLAESGLELPHGPGRSVAGSSARGEGADRIVLAGRRLAWIVYWPANTEVSADLETARLGSNRVTHVSTTIAYTEERRRHGRQPRRQRRTIAFTSYHNPGRRERRRAAALGDPVRRALTTPTKSSSEAPVPFSPACRRR